MRVIIRDDYEDMSVWVAKYVIKRIKSFKPTAERPFVLGLPTGSSPIGVYTHLVAAHKRGLVSFKHVITFNMDEYVDLPREHPETYHSFMWKHLFQHIDIKPENAHILNGNAEDLEVECKAYEDAIIAVGGIELFLAGIGSDGHIAFNEPGSSLQSKTRVKTLAYETVVANARFFDNDITKVPKMALTVGVGTVMAAREVAVVVSGQHKADALMKCIENGVNHMYTLSALQMHRRCVVICDEDATSELRVRTVKYFKGLEKVHDELLQGDGLHGTGDMDFYDDAKDDAKADAKADAKDASGKAKQEGQTAGTTKASSSTTPSPASVATSPSQLPIYVVCGFAAVALVSRFLSRK